MATQHQFRLLFVIPAASKAGFNTWCRANLNGGIGDDWFGGLGLSPSGNAPATHYWASVALTPSEFKTAGIRLCQVSGVAVPGQWDTWDRGEKKQWFLDNKAGILAGSGVRIFAMDNDGVWDKSETNRAEAGLQVIQPTIP